MPCTAASKISLSTAFWREHTLAQYPLHTMPSHLAHWQALATTDPDRLVAALTAGELPTWELSFAAEVAGALPAAHEALIELLHHESPTVREGAIYGLAKQLDTRPAIRARLKELAASDRSGAVREAAAEVVAVESAPHVHDE